MRLKLILTVLLLAGELGAQQINPGITFTDGQRITAAQLGQLVNQATINPAFYSGQVSAGTNLLATDTLLVLSSGGQYHKLLGSGVISSPSFIQSAPVSTSAPGYAAYVYNDTNLGSLYQINGTNLIASLTPLLPVNSLVFAATNSGSTNIHVQILPTYSAGSVDYTPTNALHVLVWDTNGVPKTMTISNFLNSFYQPFYTNNGSPWWWTNAFEPWAFYATNASTNAWGYYTNFAITNLFFTNSVLTVNTNTPTLVDGDAIPVQAASQGTNTTATLRAVYQYITNSLPNYSPARLQFNGAVPATVYLTNVNTTDKTFKMTGGTIFSSNTPMAVSFYIVGAPATTIPSSPQVTTNTPYYSIATGSNANFIRLYTNYSDAVNNNNPVTPSGVTVGATANRLLWLTNYTSFNADAIYLVQSGGLRTATYDVYYQTNLGTGNYYVSGLVQQASDGGSMILEMGSDGIQTGARLRVQTITSGPAAAESSRVQLLMQNP